MAYVPNNLPLFVAAMAGAISGMGSGSKTLTDPTSTDTSPTGVAQVALAFAEAFDTQWGANPANAYQVAAAQTLCHGAWEVRGFPGAVAPFLTPATWNGWVKGLIAQLTAGMTQLTGAAVVPPAATQGANFFIIDPTATPAGDVYASLATATAAAASTPGPKYYFFRGDQTVAAQAANAPYVLSPDGSPVFFRGIKGGPGGTTTGNTRVTLADGANFTVPGQLEIEELTILNQAGASGVNPIAISSGLFALFVARGSVIRQNGGAATTSFLQVSGTGNATALFFDSTTVGSDAGSVVGATGAGATLTVGLNDGANFPGSVITQAVGSTVSVTCTDNASCATGQTGTVAIQTSASTANKLFIFRPGAVAGNNVYTVWATLSSAVAAATRQGSCVVELDATSGAVTIPTGANVWASPSSQNNVEIRGSFPGPLSATAVTIADGATFQGVAVFRNLNITCQATTVNGISLTANETISFYDCTIQSTAAAPISFAAALGVANGLLAFYGNSVITGGKTLFGAGVTANLTVALYDNCSLGTNTLLESAANRTVVSVRSVHASVNMTQTALVQTPTWGVNVTWAGNLPTNTPATAPGPQNLAWTDASATVAPTPAAQTAVAALTDVIAAVVTPKFSGIFRTAVHFHLTAVAADTVTCTVTSRTKTAAIVVANGTATGVGCFVATANGPITYGGGMTTSTRFTRSIVIPAAPLTFEFAWSGKVGASGMPAGVNGFPVPTAANANNVAIAGTVQDSVAGSTISFAAGDNSIDVEEVILG